MDEVYREFLLEHYKNPLNRGKLMRAHIHKEDSNPLCGDVVEIFAKLKDDKIDKISFEGKGCVISQASTSILTEHAKGKTLNEIQNITREDLLDLIGLKLTPERVKCAMLPLTALKKGIIEYETKK